MIYCRGDKAKEEIVKQYDIVPISYVKLLIGQNKKCCCNDNLTDSYYTFSAIDNKTKKEYSFFAGESCAKKFLKLLNIQPLTLFNPFEIENNNSNVYNNSTNERGERENMHPVNKELIEAISLLSIIWNSPLLSMRNIVTFTRNRLSTPNKNGVKWFNEKISKDFKNRTLTDMCDELRKDYPTLKQFPFDNLKKVLKEDFPDDPIFL